MTNRDYWRMFVETGDIQHYLNYRKGLITTDDQWDGNSDEGYEGRVGYMADQNGGSRSGDYPINT